MGYKYTLLNGFAMVHDISECHGSTLYFDLLLIIIVRIVITVINQCHFTVTCP